MVKIARAQDRSLKRDLMGDHMRNNLIKVVAGMSLLSLFAFGAVPAGAASVIANGDFAGTPPNAGYYPVSAGVNASAIPGWTVTSGSVDWIEGFWGPTPATWPSGALSVDMNGTPVAGQPSTVGVMSQTITTDLNATYVVGFDLSGNIGCGPSTVTVSVGASGNAPVPYTDTNSAYADQWTTVGYSFTAISSSTVLTFAADPGNTSNCGAAIGNVTITETAATGAQCKNGGWKTMFEPTGVAFKNQGDCVRFCTATSGAT